ncbi:hypothetical protein IW492_13275 [Enterococcus sp. BWB1-3]|uniref:hypothetical protein n=1 Tax=unclassified Enterococcus TaxID=2608891 RepID=UPI0019225288|nr:MULTISPECIES: hypothetical protein [unclassified Enterococcus]MBL1230202.1 hypothetical protein [Enterococcus sp. BWB1-3]MCB5953755.1 hypothetical protein [Enterococcus sp. CWB-B31]
MNDFFQLMHFGNFQLVFAAKLEEVLHNRLKKENLKASSHSFKVPRQLHLSYVNPKV